MAPSSPKNSGFSIPLMGYFLLDIVFDMLHSKHKVLKHILSSIKLHSCYMESKPPQGLGQQPDGPTTQDSESQKEVDGECVSVL